jgi:electron transport complex protein RnfB
VPPAAGADPARDLLVDQIDAILPQTQCRRCGFEGCRPYARALAAGETEINRCPPGGTTGVIRLAEVLKRPSLPIDPECGSADTPRGVARIIERDCIGCTLCIQACPVDAIIGAPKRMHTVIEPHCTGCELCLAPCPVDCIVMEPLAGNPPWTANQARDSRMRHGARQERRVRRERERTRDRIAAASEKLQALDASTVSQGGPAEGETPHSVVRKRAIIEAAIRRARARLVENADGGGRKEPPA